MTAGPSGSAGNGAVMHAVADKTDTLGSKFWLAVLLLALCAYAFGLGGQYVPTNGDEMVYVHIARATADTGQWLPLASELPDTRNTKPPLLIWQAMIAGDRGQNWSLAALRLPSLIYLVLSAALTGLCVWRISGSHTRALLAACLLLAFLSNFRYGRPYLTSAAETFWFSLPMWWLLMRRPVEAGGAKAGISWLAHGLLGLAIGLGLAYKSFALVAPACAAWWLAQVLAQNHWRWRAVMILILKTAVSGLLALGVFGLWFLLDPNPQAVWQEFVVGENAGKFSEASSYWHDALRLSGSSIWSQLLAYPVNAGWLFFPVIGLAILGVKGLRKGWTYVGREQRVLLAWLLVWLLVFMVPSQRTARYVIPAMPAIAMLLALHWPSISRLWFLPTLLVTAFAGLVLARIAWVGHALALFSTWELSVVLVCVGAGIAVATAGLSRAAWTRSMTVLSCVLVYLCLNATVAPLDGPIGQYRAADLSRLSTSHIAAPNSFNGQFERYRFVLPGAHRYTPYDIEARAMARLTPGTTAPTPAERLTQLLASHDAVLWIQSAQDEVQPPCLPGCEVLGERWIFKSRHLPGEVRWDNLWRPQEWLFRREWLLRRLPG